MLVPKLRFKREDGTEYPRWENKRLGDIVEKDIIPVANPESDYIKLAIRSHGKGTFHKYIDDNGLDVETMYMVKANHLIVNITFAWEQAIAITKEEDEGTYVSHRFPQYKFINDNEPSFYKHIILSPRIKYELMLCSPGGAGRNRVLNLKDFLQAYKDMILYQSRTKLLPYHQCLPAQKLKHLLLCNCRV